MERSIKKIEDLKLKNITKKIGDKSLLDGRNYLLIERLIFRQ